MRNGLANEAAIVGVSAAPNEVSLAAPAKPSGSQGSAENRHSRAGGTAALSLNSDCAGPQGNNTEPANHLGSRLSGSDDKWLFRTSLGFTPQQALQRSPQACPLLVLSPWPDCALSLIHI